MDPLERRLEEALRNLPYPSDEASQRARGAAVGALPATGAGGRRRLPLLLAAALALGLAGGGALAAIGGVLRGEGNPSPVSRPAVTGPEVGKVAPPPVGNAVAALVDGKLWMGTRRGLTIEGLPATAAAVSPGALFMALGVGKSLVAMAPDGRRAWSHATDGSVVAAAWAPNPILIAFVVAAGDHNELWLIEGDGDRARLLVSGVSELTPSWRPDSQAIAYADARDRVMVYDRATGTVFPGGPARCGGRIPAPAVEIAFAPSGGPLARLAYITRGREVVASGPGGRGGGCGVAQPVWGLTSVGWISGTDLVVVSRPASGIMAPNSYVWRYRATARGVEERGNASIGAGAIMLHVAPARGDRMVLMVAGDPRSYPKEFGPRGMPASRLELWWVRVPPERGTVPEVHSRGTLLRLDGAAARRAASQGSGRVAWR